MRWRFSNGNLYVAERRRRTIIRLSPNGEVRTLMSRSKIGSLAAGPAGQVWFTEPDSNRIARITPSGRIEEFAVGADTVVSDPIAVSSDSVWFAVVWIAESIPDGRCVSPCGGVALLVP
jgi:streptogramin lyase